ncbi:MAG: NACHT domain-containing protein, partial [Anaerolineae bacterium]|nr:NACHT domain-containing protein [Anaerolineae bacterium]
MSQAAGFIGRQREIREISAILFRDGCRLLTLQGPGGSGKTSLAEEVARQTATHFQDGAEVVYLQSIRTPDFLASTIADAIQAPLGGQEAPAVQLLRFLQPRHLLLVLDNFEHLMVGVDLLSEILTQAPGVKLLVTSREILNLRDEWLYPVGGMAIPPEDSDDAESFDSVQLFAWYARRMRHNFALSAEIDAVARIARALQGMPLALELASSWIKTLTCAQIADEIQHNTDLLQSNLRDFPERHRSMRAVFNQSWQQLTEQEQQVFQRLSIFSGSFQLDAAQAITDASLPTLSSLVDKSLLRREADGRYQVHEQL